jgi:hypothetical protein
MTYTKEQKDQYFKDLRERWTKSKEMAKSDEMIAAWQAAQETLSKEFSINSFTDVKLQMDTLKLEGTPYIDTKTFHGWIQSGYKVKKGEKSKIKGITWVGSDDKEGEEGGAYRFPKVYSLFHKSQVEEI